MSEELEEGKKPLSITQRMARGRVMRRNKAKLKRARAMKSKRFASAENLKKRANKAALSIVKKRFAGERGKNYNDLNAAEKMSVDRMVSGKSALVARIAKRVMPMIKRKESERLAKSRTVKEQVIDEAAFPKAGTSTIILRHPEKNYSVVARRGTKKTTLRFNQGKDTKLDSKEHQDAYNHMKSLYLKGWRLAEEGGAGEIGTDELVSKLIADTPGQSINKKKKVEKK